MIMMYCGYVPSDSYSPWHLWKWCSAIFQTALLWECVIFSVYWTLLFPGDKDHLDTTEEWIDDLADHLFPILLLLTEWSLNRIYFEKN